MRSGQQGPVQDHMLGLLPVQDDFSVFSLILMVWPTFEEHGILEAPLLGLSDVSMIGFTRCIIVRTAAEVRLCLSNVSFIRNEIKGKTVVIYCVPATGWHWATCFIC